MVSTINFYGDCFRCNKSFKLLSNKYYEGLYRLIYSETECKLCDACSNELIHFLKNPEIKMKDEKIWYRVIYIIDKNGIERSRRCSDICCSSGSTPELTLKDLKSMEEHLFKLLKKEGFCEDGEVIKVLSWSRIYEN